jgi:hypothetical protein
VKRYTSRHWDPSGALDILAASLTRQITSLSGGMVRRKYWNRVLANTNRTRQHRNRNPAAAQRSATLATAFPRSSATARCRQRRSIGWPKWSLSRS